MMVLRICFLLALSSSSLLCQGTDCAATSFQSVRRDYHDDQMCDRGTFNKFKESLNRNFQYLQLKQLGNALVPDQKTVVCPSHVHNLHNENDIVGFDSVWIVENTASSPIVLSFVHGDGRESSALDPKISPAQVDPRAVVMPGDYRAVNTFEGHVFHAREMLPDGGAGRVLMQHRVGYIPIGLNQSNAACSGQDLEPVITDALTDETRIAPEYARTPPKPFLDCNALHVGFRNKVGCPVHGFFVEATENDDCHENFKFHLGVNPMTDDFMWSWDSPTKFETSYIGHTFAFRLADRPGVLVDKVTLGPTQISDCPGLAQSFAIPIGADGQLLPVARMLWDASHKTSVYHVNNPGLYRYSNSTASSVLVNTNASLPSAARCAGASSVARERSPLFTLTI